MAIIVHMFGVVNQENLNIHGGQTPSHSLFVNGLFHIDAQQSSRFLSAASKI
ncbi:hypothetical protein I656_00465 [Geobacillus sp. WSUCF1]|nr:hypothetical protein I656_00465 [Geobacillus sp. WSUCF1]